MPIRLAKQGKRELLLSSAVLLPLTAVGLLLPGPAKLACLAPAHDAANVGALP